MGIPAKQRQAIPWFGYEQRDDLNGTDLLTCFDPGNGQPFNVMADLFLSRSGIDGGTASTIYETFDEIDGGTA